MRLCPKNRWYVIVALMTLLGLSSAQNRPPSSPPPSQTSPESEDPLGTVSRRAKAQKDVHSKKIITDDDLQSSLGPLPRLKMNEAENGEDVLIAITKYKQTHSPEQTETAVRRWYDEYDKELADAIKDNLEIKALRGLTSVMPMTCARRARTTSNASRGESRN